MSRRRCAVAGAWLAALLVQGCAPSPPQSSPAPAGASCSLPSASLAVPDSLSLAIVRVDCTGGDSASVRYVRDANGRDLIDAGADLIVTGDPDLIAYAAARPELASVPMPWSRTYLLISPWHVAPLGADGSGAEDLRNALARDAVRAEARAAAPPFWWSDPGPCDARSVTPVAMPPAEASARIAYRRGDRVARGLAERLVALGSGKSTVGLEPDGFAAALRTANERAYIVDLPMRSDDPCTAAVAFVASAPFLAESDASELVPLIETRRRAIYRRDRVALAVDPAGTIRLTALAPPAEARQR